jgi:hypothetical protein
LGEDNAEHRGRQRLKLELAVEAQVGGGGYRNVQIVDISPTGLQLWTDDVSHFSSGEFQEFEVKFTARRAWTQPMGDRSFLTGWEMEVKSVEENGG